MSESPFSLQRKATYTARTPLGVEKTIEVSSGPKQQLYVFDLNQPIFYEGQAGGSAFFVKSGTVAIVRRNDEPGKFTPIAAVGPGEIFGELSLIDGNPRTAAAIAASRVEVLEMTTAQFERAIGEISEELTKRMHAITMFVREVPPRKMWVDGKVPSQAAAHLSGVLSLLRDDSGREQVAGNPFLAAIHKRIMGYARDRIP